jgi:hypothetical protein
LPTPQSPRNELITATGWRIVGRAASELAEQGAQEQLLAPPDGQTVVFALRCSARPLLGSASALPELLRVLSDEVRERDDSLPPLTRDRPVQRDASRFGGLHWDVEGDAGAWTGELLWRQPHPVRSGIACLTHVILREQGSLVTAAVRVACESLGARIGPIESGQAKPRFLAEWHARARLSIDGRPVAHHLLNESDVERFAEETLLSESRTHPIAVLAPLEDGSFVVPPEVLERELLGAAELFVLATHPATFRLTDALGDRRLSAYFGALRVYLPGFSCADAPSEHPLLVRDQVADPVERIALAGRLAHRLSGMIEWPAGIRRASAAPAATAQASQSSSQTPSATGSAASDPASASSAVVSPAPATPASAVAAVDTRALTEALLAVQSQLRIISGQFAELLDVQRAMAEELGALMTVGAVRATGTSAIDRRLALIEKYVRDAAAPAAPTDDAATDTATEPSPSTESERTDADDAPTTLAEVVRQAASRHAESLLVLESAEAAAEQSPFEDADRAAAILDAMALVARRRQRGSLGSGLREAFRELGVDYRSGISASSSKRLRQQHEFSDASGRVFMCEEHIAVGSTYDPRYCLRIYFTSRASMETRFIIGHVGRHLDVMSTT